MILTNMINGSMAQLRDPLLIHADGKSNFLHWLVENVSLLTFETI